MKAPLEAPGMVVKGAKLAALGLFLAGCSSDPVELGEASSAPSPFEPCPLFTATGEGEAECAVFERPLLSDDPDAGTIPIFVKRVRATAPRRGQYWYLQGGPGGSGQSYEGSLEELAPLLPDLDLYVLDHRGTGRSALLECPRARDHADCGAILAEEWGFGLAGFRTTEAARDVAALIRETRVPGDQVFVHGASYGGYWLHRLLAVDPDVVDGALFESSARGVSTGGYAELAAQPDEAGRRLFELCAEDEECEAHLGADGYARTGQVVDADGDCAGALDPEILTALLDHWRLQRLIPALVYRAERCNEADATFLQNLLGTVIGLRSPSDEPAEVFNTVLNRHIFHSELYGPFDEDGLDEVASTALFHRVEYSRSTHAEFADWPQYGPDDFTGVWAEVSMPVLVLHGGLDARTWLSGALELKARLGETARFVEFPTAGHGVQSWPYPEYCGRELMPQFLNDPEAPLDLSCIDAAPAFTFTTDSEWLLETFGTDNVWGD